MDASATRQRILEAAERHYAERGFDGMSMRALTSEADVNLAAVNYHFGSKKELIHAICLERIIPINRERLELLKEAQAGTGTPTLEQIFDAWLQPVALRATGPDGPNINFLRMVGRFLSEDAAFMHRLFVEEFKELSDIFKSAIKDALPTISEEELTIRFHFGVASMLGALVLHQQFLMNQNLELGVDETFTRLRDFLCAGFRAGLESKED